MPAPINIFGAATTLSQWGLAPTAAQLQTHTALATRTLVPDETHLRRAAAWLHMLFTHRPPQVEAHSLAAVLDEKSNLVHRLAHRHVPALGAELDLPDSPLYPIDAAARFLPPPSATPSPHLTALRQTVAALDLSVVPPSGADTAWHDNRRRLQQLILHDNPHRFLTWPVIINSMFMNDPAVAAPELATLQSQPDYATRWDAALREDPPRRTGPHPPAPRLLPQPYPPRLQPPATRPPHRPCPDHPRIRWRLRLHLPPRLSPGLPRPLHHFRLAGILRPATLLPRRVGLSPRRRPCRPKSRHPLPLLPGRPSRPPAAA